MYVWESWFGIGLISFVWVCGLVVGSCCKIFLGGVVCVFCVLGLDVCSVGFFGLRGVFGEKSVEGVFWFCCFGVMVMVIGGWGGFGGDMNGVDKVGGYLCVVEDDLVFFFGVVSDVELGDEEWLGL